MSGGNDSLEIAWDWVLEAQHGSFERERRANVIRGVQIPTLQDKEELMKRGCYLFVSEEKVVVDNFLNDWNQIDQMAYELLHTLLKSNAYAPATNYVSCAYDLADEFERVRKERNNPSQINFTKEN